MQENVNNPNAFCISDSAPYSSVDLEKELQDQPERPVQSVLGPPAAPRGRASNSEQRQRTRNMEEMLHNITTTLLMLKQQVRYTTSYTT